MAVRKLATRLHQRPELWLLLAAAAFLASPWFVRSPYYLHIGILFLLWLGLGEAWNIIGGFTGQVSFGHAVFFGIGAYATSLLYVRLAVPLLLGSLAGAVLAATVAVPVGLVCFRLRGPYFALSILGVAEIFRLIAINWRDLTGGPVGILFPPVFRNKLPFYYVAIALATLAVVLAWWILHSRLGFRMRAVREDEEAASASGIPPTSTKLQALLISAVLTGLFGGFFAPYQGYIDPDVVFSLFDISIPMVVVVVLGGIGTVWGPALGAAVVVVLAELVRRMLGSVHLLTYAALLVVIVRYLPGGLLSLLVRRRMRVTEVASPEQPAALGEPVADPVLIRPPARPSPTATTIQNPQRTLLHVRGVVKTFGGLVALNGVNVEVSKGEIIGLIGPNGAGKTTLISVISGFLRPDAGRVVFNNADITGVAPHQVARLGLVRTFQLTRVFSRMTAWENVATATLLRGYSLAEAKERADYILHLLDLYRRRNDLAGNLTLAERKRLELARALATEPSLLLLDEVAAGLTQEEHLSLVQLLERVRNLGVTILVVEHVMQVVMSVADRLAVLHHGQVIAQGRPEEIARNPEVVEAYLGANEVEAYG